MGYSFADKSLLGQFRNNRWHSVVRRCIASELESRADRSWLRHGEVFEGNHLPACKASVLLRGVRNETLEMHFKGLFGIYKTFELKFLDACI